MSVAAARNQSLISSQLPDALRVISPSSPRDLATHLAGARRVLLAPRRVSGPHGPKLDGHLHRPRLSAPPGPPALPPPAVPARYSERLAERLATQEACPPQAAPSQAAHAATAVRLRAPRRDGSALRLAPPSGRPAQADPSEPSASRVIPVEQAASGSEEPPLTLRLCELPLSRLLFLPNGSLVGAVRSTLAHPATRAVENRGM